jgi:diguanylate cyclase (GGDEF)-like protein
MIVEPISVLLVEPAAEFADLAERALANSAEHGIYLNRVANLGDALNLFKTRRFEAVITALALPDSEPTDAVRALIDHTSVVLVSASAAQSQVAATAVHAGALDVLPREEFSTTLAVRALRFARERQRLQAEVTALRNLDPLTGVLSRSRFLERVGLALTQAGRSNKAPAVLLIDLDDFKTVNTNIGIEGGDQVLRNVAKRLSTCLRETDCIGRLGADEFGVLIDDAGESTVASEVAEKIAAAVRQPYSVRGNSLQMSVSVGIAVWPEDGGTATELLRNAQGALLRARRLGPGQFQFVSEHRNAQASERLALESSLKRAIDQNELALYFQPRVEAPSGRIVGFDSLLRWRHPDIGVVLPLQFVGPAEETNMVLPLGQWVVSAACRQLRAWMSEGMPTRLAVNLSEKQFFEPSFAESVCRLLADIGVDGSSLEFEIREVLLNQNPSAAKAAIRRFKALGVSISLDQFGAAHTSLRLLKRLAIDYVKLSRSFIQNIPEDGHNGAMLHAIVAMSQHLGFQVVAQGIETEQQLDYLVGAGVKLLQGFHLCRPAPAADITPLLQKGKLEVPMPALRSDSTTRPIAEVLQLRPARNLAADESFDHTVDLSGEQFRSLIAADTQH